jgi:hypothetical protein
MASENIYGDLPCDYASAYLTGSGSDGVVTLTGSITYPLSQTPVNHSWLLRFDPQTQHLRGTINGQNAWLVPLNCPWPLPTRRRCGIGI